MTQIIIHHPQKIRPKRNLQDKLHKKLEDYNINNHMLSDGYHTIRIFAHTKIKPRRKVRMVDMSI